MTKAAKLGTGCWGLGAGLGTRCWGLGARENPPEPNSQPPAPRTQHLELSPQPPVPSRETRGCELAAEVLRSSGRLRLRATGASMLPTVWPGDVLYVRSHDAVGALPGDIVLFARQGRLVAHRVVEVRSQETGVRSQERSPIAHYPSPVLTFVTRGDSAEGNDAPVSSHELLGRAITIERGSCRLNPRLTLWRRIVASILSRSEFCTRLLLRLRKTVTKKRGRGTGDTRLGICDL